MHFVLTLNAGCALMERLEEFRLFYNQTIYPELLRMERRRLRLIGLLFVSFLLIGGLVALQFYLNLLLTTLLLLIPIVAYSSYLIYQIQEFRRTFKPNVVELLLDFIDNGINFDTNHPLSYYPEEGITKDQFLESGLFVTTAPYYASEDTIKGRIGELEFELSELNVKELSPIRNDLEEVFKGVFLHATFKAEVEGRMIVLPREKRQFTTRAIKEFVFRKGKNKDEEILNPTFREIFMTYATDDMHVAGILTEPLQEALVQIYQETRRMLYFSFIDKDFYIAIAEPKDLLEPFIFWSNLSYDLIKEFMEDINLILRLVQEFDQKI